MSSVVSKDFLKYFENQIIAVVVIIMWLFSRQSLIL